LENKKQKEAPANKEAQVNKEVLANKEAPANKAPLPPTIQELENKKQEPVNQEPVNEKEPKNKPLTEPVPPKI